MLKWQVPSTGEGTIIGFCYRFYITTIIVIIISDIGYRKKYFRISNKDWKKSVTLEKLLNFKKQVLILI